MAKEVIIPGGRDEETKVHLAVGQDEHAVKQPTVYNWIELIYQACGYTVPSAANEHALLGIREGNVSASASEDGDWTRGSRTGDRGKKTKDKKGRDIETSTTFDDAVALLWTPKKATEKQGTKIYAATIDPGGDEKGTVGTPYLLEGKLYHAKPGLHGGKNALHLYTASPGSIALLREATKKTRIFMSEPSALTAPSTDRARWAFAADEPNGTIHLHFFYGGTKVKNTSTGCTALAHTAGSKVFQDFITRCRGAANKTEIPYLVVSSRYIVTYEDWAAAAKKTKGKLEPKSVVRKEGLQLRPKTKQALPSVLSVDFAKAVDALIADLQTCAAGAAAGPPASPATLKAFENVAKHRERMDEATRARFDATYAATKAGKAPKNGAASAADLTKLATVLATALDYAMLPASLQKYAQ